MDFVTSCKDILVSKIHCGSSDICMNVETRYFLIFLNILGTKNIQNRIIIFSSSTKYYSLQEGSILFKKVLTSLLASFALPKNKHSEASRIIVGTLPPL